jgi:hypothetical protein
MARFFHSRGLRVEGLELRAAVPISIRSHSDQPALGNRITQVVTPLPIYISDPVQRLRRVTREMNGLKESKQALGAEAIAGAEDFAPPTILAQASRVNFSSRFYNLLVTNVPGPQFPLYVMGRRLELIFPVAFLAGDRALAIAIMSYSGSMNFGLIGDYDALPDIDVIAEGIEDALAELLSRARGERPRRSPRRRTTTSRPRAGGKTKGRAGAARASGGAAAKKTAPDDAGREPETPPPGPETTANGRSSTLARRPA